jgi:hypothetical protein
MAHAHRRTHPPAARNRTGWGSEAKLAFHGTDASASPPESVGNPRDTERFSSGAGYRATGASARSITAAAPVTAGLAGANARLRTRMAEIERNGIGRRQNLVRIRPGLPCQVNLLNWAGTRSQTPQPVNSIWLPVRRRRICPNGRLNLHWHDARLGTRAAGVFVAPRTSCSKASRPHRCDNGTTGDDKSLPRTLARQTCVAGRL